MGVRNPVFLQDQEHRDGAGRRTASCLFLMLALLFYTLPTRAAWVDVQVSADADDAEERVSSGNMNLTSSDLEMVDEGGSAANRQLVGMRFVNVDVANSATILEAYLEFETDETDSGTTNLTFRAEDADNPGAFTTTNGNISSRTTTTASTAWNNVPAWNTTSEHHLSPDIAAVVQEVVDRGGWVADNAMVYIVNGNGERTAESHNGEPDAAAILRIKYDGKRAAPGSNICFSVADGGNVLVTADTTNGNETLIGSTESPDGDYGTSVEGIAYNSVEGDLYGADQDILGRLDQSTGQFYRLKEFFGTGSGADGNVNFTAVQGLAFDRSSSSPVLYAINRRGDSNYLLLVEEETGAHIGNAFDTDGNGSGDADYVEITGAGFIDDIAIDTTDGTIYVIADGDELFTVARSNSSSTWSATSVGTVTRSEGGTVPSDIEGLGFDDSGQLFGSTGNSGTNAQRNSLWSIDKSDADTTLVGALSEGTDYEALACAFSTPTRAVVEGVRAYASAVKGAIVEWETASERGTLGFHLERLDPKTGKYRRVNKKLLPGLLHARNGGLYRFGDLGVRAGQEISYRLVEIEATGGKLIHGPFPMTVSRNAWESEYQPSSVGAGTSTDPSAEAAPGFGLSASQSDDDNAADGFERVERALSPHQKARRVAKREARKLARNKKKNRRGSAAKIHVRQSGMYRLDASDLAEVLGKSVAAIEKLIARNRLRLTTGGKPVATHAAENGEAMFFYGKAAEGPYSAETVYWIAEGRGVAMGTERGKRPSPGSSFVFRHTERVEGNRYSITHLFDDPDADYWMWDFRFENLRFPMYQDVFNVPTHGRATDSDNSAILTVRLHGGSDARHTATIVLNGNVLGSTTFEGLAPHTAQFEVDGRLLNDGDNDIELLGSASGNPNKLSSFYLNDIAISYARKSVAREDTLVFDGGGKEILSVSGFTAPEITVFDLGNPKRPRHLIGLNIDGDQGNYRASFRAHKNGSRYLALDLRTALSPQRIIADRPSKLAKRAHRADYVVITSSDMVEAAQRLADFRATTQGLRTMVVDVEDVYDEFNHGNADPEAIWRFLRYARTEWRGAPRYVVLAGEGSFDYKNYLGHGDSIIPALLTPTPYGLFPSDNLYADVVGNDWLPDMAIGRLPVISAGELQGLIDKLIAYESAGGAWETRAIFAADVPDLGGDFPRASEAIATHLPGEYTVDRLYLDDMTAGEARTLMLSGINAGRAFINFFGHSGFLSLGNGKLLTASDAATLTNQARLPVLTAFTCLAGQFGFPGQEGLGETLVISPGGGAVAVWAPSGLSLNPLAKRLSEGFYASTFDNGERLIGEAILQAQAHYARAGRDRYLLDIYNLLGDPVTIMK